MCVVVVLEVYLIIAEYNRLKKEINSYLLFMEHKHILGSQQY